jgi:hypothetical protein
VPKICRECLQESSLPWFLHVGKVLALGAATYGVAWLAVTLIGSFTLAVLVAAYLLASAAFAIGAYAMIGPDLRETLQRLRGNLFARKAGAL